MLVFITQEEYDAHLVEAAEVEAKRRLGIPTTFVEPPVRYEAIWRWDVNYPKTIESGFVPVPSQHGDVYRGGNAHFIVYREAEVLLSPFASTSTILALPCESFEALATQQAKKKNTRESRYIPATNLTSCHTAEIKALLDEADKVDDHNIAISRATTDAGSAVPTSDSEEEEELRRDETKDEIDRQLFYIYERTHARFFTAYRARESDFRREVGWSVGPENEASENAGRPVVWRCKSPEEVKHMVEDARSSNVEVRTDFRWYFERARDQAEYFKELVQRAEARLAKRQRTSLPLVSGTTGSTTTPMTLPGLSPWGKRSLEWIEKQKAHVQAVSANSEAKEPTDLSEEAIDDEEDDEDKDFEDEDEDGDEDEEEHQDAIADPLHKLGKPSNTSCNNSTDSGEGIASERARESGGLPTLNEFRISSDPIASPDAAQQSNCSLQNQTAESNESVASSPKLGRKRSLRRPSLEPQQQQSRVVVCPRPKPIAAAGYLVDALHGMVKYMASLPSVLIVSSMFSPHTSLYPTATAQRLPLSFSVLATDPAFRQQMTDLLKSASTFALSDQATLKRVSNDCMIGLHRHASVSLIDGAVARSIYADWNPDRYVSYFSPNSIQKPVREEAPSTSQETKLNLESGCDLQKACTQTLSDDDEPYRSLENLQKSIENDVPLTWTIQPYLGPLYNNPLCSSPSEPRVSASAWPLVQLVSSSGDVLAADISGEALVQLSSHQFKEAEIYDEPCLSFHICTVNPAVTVEAAVAEQVRRRREIRQLNRLFRMRYGTKYSRTQRARELKASSEDLADAAKALFAEEDRELAVLHSRVNIESPKTGDGEGKHAAFGAEGAAVPYLDELVEVLDDYYNVVTEERFHTVRNNTRISPDHKLDLGTAHEDDVSHRLSVKRRQSRVTDTLIGKDTLTWKDGVFEPELDNIHIKELRSMMMKTQHQRESLLVRQHQARVKVLELARQMGADDRVHALEIVMSLYGLNLRGSIAQSLIEEARERYKLRKGAAAALRILSDPKTLQRLPPQEYERLRQRVLSAGLSLSEQDHTEDIEVEKRLDDIELKQNDYLTSLYSIDDGDDEKFVQASGSDVETGEADTVDSDLRAIRLSEINGPRYVSVWRIIPASVIAPRPNEKSTTQAVAGAERANILASAVSRNDPSSAFSCADRSPDDPSQFFGSGLAGETNLQGDFILQLAACPETPELIELPHQGGSSVTEWAVSGCGILYATAKRQNIQAYEAACFALDNTLTEAGAQLSPSSSHNIPRTHSQAVFETLKAMCHVSPSSPLLRCSALSPKLCSLGPWDVPENRRITRPVLIPLSRSVRWSFVEMRLHGWFAKFVCSEDTPSQNMQVKPDIQAKPATTLCAVSPLSPGRSAKTAQPNTFSWVMCKDSAFEDPLSTELARSCVRTFSLREMPDLSPSNFAVLRKAVSHYNYLRFIAARQYLTHYSQFEPVKPCTYLNGQKERIILSHALQQSQSSLTRFAQDYERVISREAIRLVRDLELRAFRMFHAVPATMGPKVSQWTEIGCSYYSVGGADSHPAQSFVRQRKLANNLTKQLGSFIQPAIAELRRLEGVVLTLSDAKTKLEGDLARAELGLRKAQQVALRSDRYIPDCIICFEKPVNSILVPCGHIVCDDCVGQLQQCPFCRTRVKSSQRVYLVR